MSGDHSFGTLLGTRLQSSFLQRFLCCLILVIHNDDFEDHRTVAKRATGILRRIESENRFNFGDIGRRSSFTHVTVPWFRLGMRPFAEPHLSLGSCLNKLLVFKNLCKTEMAVDFVYSISVSTIALNDIFFRIADAGVADTVEELIMKTRKSTSGEVKGLKEKGEDGEGFFK